jgi:hypothetical protein
MVELDGQLVAVHGGDVAVAEFLVEHAGAIPKTPATPRRRMNTGRLQEIVTL